jgi:hypothetical protein
LRIKSKLQQGRRPSAPIHSLPTLEYERDQKRPTAGIPRREILEASAILQPVIAVAVLSMVVTFWMIATRVPEMNKRRIDPQRAQNTSKLHDLLPPEIMRISNNYNHLFEQPTVFYAVAISIAVLGHVDSINVGLAWAYAGLRVVHSFVQATVDIVMIRFGLFLVSSIVLAVIVIREALALL